ncbi:MAG: hypothetical protein Q9163_002620 [Psora crenata]
MDDSWGAPSPEAPPPGITLPPEVKARLKAVRIQDIDLFGWTAGETKRKERNDADFEMFRRMNDEATQARVHTEHERARRHRPSPSPTPPPPSQPAPQPQPQPHKRPAKGAEEEDHPTEANTTPIPKRQRRGVEMMDEGTRKEETGKRKLADVDEENDHITEESAWTASKHQKMRTDINEQDLYGAGGSVRVPAKRHIRQAKTSKKICPRATTDKAETRQEQRAGRRPYTRSTRRKLLVSLHPTKKGTVVYDNTGAAPQESEDKTCEGWQA